MFKRISLVLLLSVSTVFTIAGCSKSGGDSILPFSRGEYKVESGALVMKDSYISSVEPATKSVLAFKFGGRIVDMNVDKGSIVRKGDILARVDGAEARIAMQSAQAMSDALDALKQSTIIMFDAQVDAIEQKVDQANIAMKLAKISGTSGNYAGDLQLGQAGLGYQTAQVELENTKSVLAEQEKQLYNNAKNALAQTKVFLDPLGLFLDEFLGVSDSKKIANDSFENFISAKDTDQKIKIKDMRLKLNKEYSSLGVSITDISNSFDSDSLTQVDKDNIYNLLTKTEAFLVQVRGLLKEFYKAIDSSITSSAFSQETINQYKNYIVIYQSNLEKVLLTVEGNYMLGVKGVRQSMDTFKEHSRMQIELLTQKTAIAGNQYKLTNVQLQAQQDIAQKQYKEAQAGLQAIKKQKDAQISQISIQQKQIQGNLAMTQSQLSDAFIVAPFDGVILEKMAEGGQIVGQGMPIFSIGDPSQGKVVIYVPDSKIANIKKSQKLGITIPSLNLNLSGIVDNISPIADMMSKRIAVEAIFPIIDTNIKFGLQANVVVEQTSLYGLIIPNEYVVYDMTQTFVYTPGTGEMINKIPVDVIGCQDNMCVIQDVKLNTILRP